MKKEKGIVRKQLDTWENIYMYSRNTQNIHMNREKDRGGTRWFEIDGGSEKNVPK